MWGAAGVHTFPRMTDHHASTSDAEGRSRTSAELGLRALADVAGFISTGLGPDEVLAGVAGALARTVRGTCRAWVRTPDAAAFRAIGPPGSEVPPDATAAQVEQWLTQPGDVDGTTMRLALEHEGERLGMLETSIAAGPDADRPPFPCG